MVALISHRGQDSEVTVKRLYRRGRGGQRQIVLRPENRAYEEIVCGEGEVEVQGRVVYVAHPPR